MENVVTTKPFTVLLDLDSTCYDLLNPTLEWVNKTYRRNLTPCDIKEWHWNKPLGVDPYEFWAMEGTFLRLKPITGAIQAIRKVHDWGIKQTFFSTVVASFAGWEKFEAVDRDFPFIGRKRVLLTGGDKDLAYGDMLVDDGPHNLETFNGITVLADFYKAPYCRTGKRRPDVIMTSWKQYPEIVLGAVQVANVRAAKGWEENCG